MNPSLRKFYLGIGKSCLHRCLIRKSERRRDGVFLSGEKNTFYFWHFSVWKSVLTLASSGEEVFWVCVWSQLQEIDDPGVQTGVRRYRKQVQIQKLMVILLQRFYHLCSINLLQMQVGVRTAEYPTTRVAELGSLSSGAKMAMKIFVKRVFTIFASNALFLRVIANLQN